MDKGVLIDLLVRLKRVRLYLDSRSLGARSSVARQMHRNNP